ncbi:MAG: hypothetical protein AB1656_21350 [Candidatus Omnitrophota bacterium]
MRYFKVAILRFLLITALAPAPHGAWADRVKPMSLDAITEGARTIFQGECTEIKSAKDPESGLMATWYTFKIAEGIKGKIGEQFVLKQYGGTDGKITVNVPGVKYKVGEKAVLFLYGQSQIGFSSAVGMQQGKFTIIEDKEKNAKYVTNGMPAMLLFANMAQSVPTVDKNGLRTTGAARLRADRMELKPFLDEVRSLVKKQAEKEKKADQ